MTDKTTDIKKKRVRYVWFNKVLPHEVSIEEQVEKHDAYFDYDRGGVNLNNKYHVQRDL